MKDLYSIRPLVWVDQKPLLRCDFPYWRATTPFGQYHLLHPQHSSLPKDSWMVYLEDYPMLGEEELYGSLKEAKAAAQAHYDERMTPALKLEGER